MDDEGIGDEEVDHQCTHGGNHRDTTVLHSDEPAVEGVDEHYRRGCVEDDLDILLCLYA